VSADDRRDDPRYQRLIDATRELAMKGYDAVSMRELANATHMSLTTIYQLGGSKDQLIAEAHADRMEHFREQLRRRPPRGSTAEARVKGVVRGYVTALDRDRERTLAMMRAFYALPADVSESRTSVRATYELIIDAAIGDEDVPDRTQVIDTLGHVMNSAILEWMNGTRDAAAVQRILDDAVHVLFRQAPGSGSPMRE
jgi:TetR/AcrR family transcriptional regulator, cholesterol catabolism regulator